MAESGGHWNTLAEAQKLTQSTKIPGVFEEDVKRNNPLERLPVAQAAGTGLKIEWLRENAIAESAVQFTSIGDQLSWSEDITYTEVESTLRRLYIQRKLDHYVQGIYGTYNDYKAQVLLESEKGLKRRVGDKLCLLGNIDMDVLARGNPQEVEELVKRNLKEIAPGGGYVVGSSNSVPEYIPLANYNAMVKTTLKLGRYPITL